MKRIVLVLLLALIAAPAWGKDSEGKPLPIMWTNYANDVGGSGSLLGGYLEELGTASWNYRIIYEMSTLVRATGIVECSLLVVPPLWAVMVGDSNSLEPNQNFVGEITLRVQGAPRKADQVLCTVRFYDLSKKEDTQ